jgi:cytosine/adenosine deaminase-related metal-dependent hydrolase
MRMALQVQRALDNDGALSERRMPEQLSVSARDALGWATIDGARAIGLDAQVGSLTPGKAADLIVVRADRLSTAPVHDPVAAVVLQAGPADVEAVVVEGRFRKRGGQLEADVSAAAAEVDGSARHLREALEARGGLLPPAPDGFQDAVMANSLSNVGRGPS